MHIVDLGTSGPALEANSFKNLSIDDAILVLEQEAKEEWADSRSIHSKRAWVMT